MDCAWGIQKLQLVGCGCPLQILFGKSLETTVQNLVNLGAERQKTVKTGDMAPFQPFHDTRNDNGLHLGHSDIATCWLWVFSADFVSQVAGDRSAKLGKFGCREAKEEQNRGQGTFLALPSHQK